MVQLHPWKGEHRAPRSSHSALFKDMVVCEALQRDTCPDNQASSLVMVDFSDIGGKSYHAPLGGTPHSLRNAALILP
ncbi:hypothetical protein TNCV_2091271 [Trichonephila clavipes]|nr:hypothetical protein TNCV_2091271 [Trichonephila clavipes]